MAQAMPNQPKFLPRIERMVTTANSFVATASGNPFDVEEEDEIFSKQKMVLRVPSDCTGDLMHLTVSKNWLVCLLGSPERTTLLRFFLPRAIPPGEVALERYLSGSGYKITKIFLDHTGHHLVISVVPKSTSAGVSADFLYINSTESSTAQQLKVRRIEKFKDHEITAVAFNPYYGNESTTGPILLGTSRGLVFETELSPTSDSHTQRKQLYDLGLGRPKYPITGLKLLRVPNSSRYIVVVTSPECIYTFQETLKPEERTLQPIFAGYVNGVQEPHCEERKTDLTYSQLRFFAPPNSKYPKQWAWLCGAGIRVGEFSIEANGSATLLGDTLISLDFEKAKHLSYEERRLNVPKAFVLTEYHAVLLYADHIRAVCLLNQEVVYQEPLDEARVGKPLNIERDDITGSIYVYTVKAVFNLRITREERNVWRIYLDRGQYELATAHAAEVPEHLDLVLVQRADAAFTEGSYEVAADYYAETGKSFEEVCLKFMVLPDKRPIINYVKKRLSRLTTMPADMEVMEEEHATAIKALVVWLIDLYLIQINMPDQNEDWRQAWQTEYDEFMQEPPILACTTLHSATVQQLIAEHADPHNMAQFAIAIGDYQEVVEQQLKAERFAEALQTLGKQRDMQLYYKYAPVLMEKLPKPTIDVLIAQGANLEVEKLVPTLIVIDTREQREQTIRYLEFAIYKLNTTNDAIHNFLLHLYAQYEPKLLMKYLEIQGRDESLVHYDIHYALKVCTDLDVKEACVFLQCILRMWISAVDLALKFDMKLAKETASRPTDSRMRRKVWLRIAYHDIKGTNDVKKALNLLKECELLRIEDLLPFFSDFEKIDNFKEAICDALKDYNQRIQELQREMAETQEQSDRVGKELQQLREHRICIDAQDTCSICEIMLPIRPFFAFICGHKFHSDCLEKQVMPLLNKERSRRLGILKQQLEAEMQTQSQTQTTATASAPNQPTVEQQLKRSELKTEIEDILASDCLYCSLFIETIDQPFVDDWEQVNVEWE
ncbi:vacuolar protein sorting-associated protein 18 homolog isoform X1 [Drosophila obscura]|uniref:vacuolar protein sorting-associated protein 18 homolog isoform X1 n=1 Tax=Drosophila obscura TaxID=7282 RepID=UPI001BB18BE1|nr:vacuolar protein sorting-associated protein 18 homolog isoform X1 [Drosophila obscura]